MTSQNNTPPNNDKYKSVVREYLSTNLLLPIWSLFLFFGGAIFLIYYAQINFLPDLDASAIVTLLAVASITGGIFLVCISAGLIMPGLFWSIYVVRVRRFARLWRGNGARAKKRISITFIVLSIPLGILVSVDSLWGLRLTWFIIGLVVSCVLAGAFAYLLVKWRGWGNRRTRLRWWDFLALGTLGTLSWLFCTLPFGFVLTLASRQGQRLNEWDLIITVILILALLVVINLLIPTFERKGRSAVWITVIALVTSLIVMKSLNTTISLSAAVMRQYGLGGIPNATMVLNQQGCSTMGTLGLATTCVQNDGACRVDQVQILSRLGSTFYLSVSQKGQFVSFTLPNSVVISWTKETLPPCKITPTTDVK